MEVRMGEENLRKPIVIANAPPKEYLWMIGLDGRVVNEIKFHYNNKHEQTVELLLRMLRKSFGWREVNGSRKKVEVYNNVCKYKENKLCTNPKIRHPGVCTEQVRTLCKGYTKKYDTPFIVNEVKIAKVSAIIGM